MGRILSVLEEIDADVVGLQEVGWHRRTHHRIDQFSYLREFTDYTVVEGLVRDPLRAQFGNALLTRLPVDKVCWVDLKIPGHVPRGEIGRVPWREIVCPYVVFSVVVVSFKKKPIL